MIVQNVTFLGLLKCWVQGHKVVAFPLQTIYRDEMELSLITFWGLGLCADITALIGAGVLCVDTQVMICKCD